MPSRKSIILTCLFSALLTLSACAATGGFAGATKEALCAVHNSSEMKALCEVPGGK